MYTQASPMSNISNHVYTQSYTIPTQSYTVSCLFDYILCLLDHIMCLLFCEYKPRAAMWCFGHRHELGQLLIVALPQPAASADDKASLSPRPYGVIYCSAQSMHCKDHRHQVSLILCRSVFMNGAISTNSCARILSLGNVRSSKIDL